MAMSGGSPSLARSRPIVIFTAAVKITIGRLRAKLGDPPLIATVPRSGYQIRDQP